MSAEHIAAAHYLAFELQQACPSRPATPKAPAPPPTARKFGDPVGLSFYTANRRLKDPTLRPTLQRVAEAMAPLVSRQILRELIRAATPLGADQAHIEGAYRLATSLVFRAVSTTEQTMILRIYGRQLIKAHLREAYLDIMERPALLGLEPSERAELLRYVAGPLPGRYSHPSHRSMLPDRWGDRIYETPAWARLRLDDPEARPQILAYLHEPVQPFHIMRTTTDKDLSIFVFGAIDDPYSLSYCRSVELDRGRLEASVISPDPRVASGWTGTDPLSGAQFECRTTRLTRLEELELIRWIEDNHSIAPQANLRPRRLPFAIFMSARTFPDAIEPIAAMLSSIRGRLRYERTMVHRGQPYHEQQQAMREVFANLKLPAAVNA